MSSLLLSIETSTTVCSAALHNKGRLLATRESHTPQSAASQLAVQIDSLFVETGIAKTDLRAVAVSSGPGSYTGLRIGVATAKGICVGLDVPLIAINSLEVLCASVDPSMAIDLLCPMIDARRMEVYCAIFDRKGKIIEKTQAKVIDDQSFANQLDQNTILFFGNGSGKCEGVIRHPHATFAVNLYPAASKMGDIAFQKWQSSNFEDRALFEPNYMKEFVAKTKST